MHHIMIPLQNSLSSRFETPTIVAAADPRTLVYDNQAFPVVAYSAIGILTLLVPLIAKELSGRVHNWSPIATRFLWVVSFIVNVVTVSIPGRFDGLAIEAEKRGDKNGPKFKGGIPWTPVFAPAGWAFAIWACIYLGESIVTSYVGLFGNSVALLLKKALPWWMAGNLLQSLWCGSFRPEFSNHLYVPASLLVLAAGSFIGCHNQITQHIDAETNLAHKIGLLLFRFPVTLHLGWLCAASLLNLNGWAARMKLAMGSQVALAGLSSYLAFLLGASLTLLRGDPFVALTFAWALKAVAVQTLSKSAAEALQLPAITKESLSMTEAGLSYALIVVAAIAPFVQSHLRNLDI